MAPVTYKEFFPRAASLPAMPVEPASQPAEEALAEYTPGSFAAAIAAPIVIFICIIVLLIAFHMISRQPSLRHASRSSNKGKKHRTWSDPETIQIGRMSSVIDNVGNGPDTTIQANSESISTPIGAIYPFDHIAPSQATTVSTIPSASNSLVRLPGQCAHPA